MPSIAAALQCFAVLYNNDTELPTIPADTVRVQSSTVLRRCEHQGRQQRHRPRRLAPLSFGRGKTRRPAPNDNEYEVTNPGSAGLVWRPKEPGRGQGAKSASPSSMFHPPFRPPCPSSVLLASSAPRVCLSTPARMACMCGGDDGTCLHHGPRAPPPLPGRDSIAMACGCSSGPPLPDHNKMSRPREWERRHRGHCSTGCPAKSPSRSRLSSGRV